MTWNRGGFMTLDQTKGLFYIQTYYRGENCLLLNPQAIGPSQFQATKIPMDSTSKQLITIDPNLIQFPSIPANKGLNNLNQHILFLIFSALSTSRYRGGSARMNCGFGVLNGEIDCMIKNPARHGEGMLLNDLQQRVAMGQCDWSIYFHFTQNHSEKQDGIAIAILHPEYCQKFFIPFTFEQMEDGGFYFNINATKIELLKKNKGVPLRTRSSIRSTHLKKFNNRFRIALFNKENKKSWVGLISIFTIAVAASISILA